MKHIKFLVNVILCALSINLFSGAPVPMPPEPIPVPAPEPEPAPTPPQETVDITFLLRGGATARLKIPLTLSLTKFKDLVAKGFGLHADDINIQFGQLIRYNDQGKMIHDGIVKTDDDVSKMLELYKALWGHGGPVWVSKKDQVSKRKL